MLSVSNEATVGHSALPSDARISPNVWPMVLKWTDPGAGNFAVMDLPNQLERVKQVKLVGYLIKNPSSLDSLRIEVRAESGSSNGLASGMSTASNMVGGMNSIYIPNYALTEKVTIATWLHAEGKLSRFQFRITNPITDANVTFDSALLFFEVTKFDWFF